MFLSDIINRIEGGDVLYISKKKMLIAVSVIIGLIALFTVLKYVVHVYGDEYEIAPGCDKDGGVFKRCVLCNKEICIEAMEPNGHNSVWITKKEPTAATPGVRELRCSVCKQQLDLIKLPAKESPIPSLKLTGSGVGMTDKNSISASFLYTNGVSSDGKQGSTAGGTAKVRLMQGEMPNTSKHSYVLTDFKLTEGDTLLFGAFGDCSEIHLYSNNDDLTRARRIVSYRQWRDLVVENYPQYAKFISVSDDTEMAGYNMLMYIKSTKNDYSFAGVYTLSIPYSTLAEKNVDAGIESVFKHTTSFDGKYKLTAIFDDEDYTNEHISALDELLNNVNLVETRCELNVIIDYYAFALLTGNKEALTELYWVTSDGDKWYPIPSNTEHTYGSVFGTVALSDPDYSIDTQGFWNEFYTKYYDRIEKRTQELSSGRLSAQNIEREFTRAVSTLDENVYEEDANTYGAIYKSPADEVKALVEWYQNRLIALS